MIIFFFFDRGAFGRRPGVFLLGGVKGREPRFECLFPQRFLTGVSACKLIRPARNTTQYNNESSFKDQDTSKSEQRQSHFG